MYMWKTCRQKLRLFKLKSAFINSLTPPTKPMDCVNKVERHSSKRVKVHHPCSPRNWRAWTSASAASLAACSLPQKCHQRWKWKGKTKDQKKTTTNELSTASTPTMFEVGWLLLGIILLWRLAVRGDISIWVRNTSMVGFSSYIATLDCWRAPAKQVLYGAAVMLKTIAVTIQLAGMQHA